MAMGKFFRIYEKLRSPDTYSIILEHRNLSEALLFESEAVAALSSSEVESLKPTYKKISEAYGCLGVLQIDSDDKTYMYLVLVTSCLSIGKIYDSEIFRITQTNLIPLQYSQYFNEDRITEVKKLLNSGTFYFSWSMSAQSVIDITLNVQQRYTASDINATNNQFLWNRTFHVHLLRYNINTGPWLLKAMCGNVEIRTVYVGSKQARAVIISRLSCERAGTRFNVRGANDEGHVANFVETEQVIYLDNEVSTFIQTRGSVPLFWEQPGIQVGSHKIKISRGFEFSAPALNKHFHFLKKRYGHQVIVNLLSASSSTNKEGEAMLSQLFQLQQTGSEHSDIPHIIFDYHQECRGGNVKNLSKLKEQVEKYLDEFSYFFAVGKNVISFQKGTIRTNCLDCLDRTNCVQTFFALEILEKQLRSMKLVEKQTIVSRFIEVFRQMWINNGNEISKIYAGTGAIQGNSKFFDGARSAARTIQNNLLDSTKQEAIDILLFGSTLNTDLADRVSLYLSSKMSHAPLNILKEMCNRYTEYVDTKKLRVGVATYNVNGGKHFRSVAYKDVTLADWLLDAPENSSTLDQLEYDSSPVDIYAIGFQEIVDLNASNIMAASGENSKAWADELQKVLSRDQEYYLVTYQQLVGVCLYIFIKPCHINYLKDVAVDSVKTGLGGAAGNKGAVGIRFALYSTSFCFVCSHFAAGQNQVAERNMDYSEITKRIIFPMERTINTHDYVFWCGDFNYRVDMDKDEMKEMIKQNELEAILNFDQLTVQKQQGNIFHDYMEGKINFPPTYKYDLFSDDYDTSEKMRQPAWTDRVLWKRQKLMQNSDTDVDMDMGKIVFYGRSELKQSDHRPVIAIIDIEVNCVNTEKRDLVFKKVITDLGPHDSTIIIKKIESFTDPDASIDSEFMESLIQYLNEFGEIILVRFVDDDILITFKNGSSALAVMNRGITEINGQKVQITLRSPDWITCIEKEIGIFEDTKVALQAQDPFNLNRHFDDLTVNTDVECRRSKSPPPPRPVPPTKFTESVPVVAKNIMDSKEPNFTLPQVPQNIPPPLPPRQGGLPPPKTLPPAPPPIESPPPVPTRSAGPPLPKRNTDQTE